MRFKRKIFPSEAGPFAAGNGNPASMFTPRAARMIAPDQPTIGARWGMGSYIPEDLLVPFAKSEPAFTAAGDGGSVFPGFGLGIGTEQLFPSAKDFPAMVASTTPAEAIFLNRQHSREKMENTVGSLGAEAWEDILKTGVQSGLDTVLKYQQARISAKQADTQARIDAARGGGGQIIQRPTNWMIVAGFAVVAYLILKRR